MSLQVDITKHLGDFELRVAFETEQETLALLGASGCGKSMTLKCIAGVEKPDSGRIVLDGTVLFDSEKHINLPPQKRRVGYLFQQYALFPNMTVEQNIAAGAHATPRAERAALVKNLIHSLRLEGLEKKRPSQLSGGQQQRTALARILASAPSLLLLDEPFSALDGYLKWQVELELADLLNAFGGTVVWVSHDRNEVYRNCDTVCVLSAGKSEPKQSVAELFRAPQTLASCLLSGCKNFSHIERLSQTRVRALDWGVELTVPEVPETASLIGIRAHYIKPVTQPGENTVRCRVERVVEDVFSTVVMLTPPGGSGEYARIRIELTKEEWAALDNPAELLLYMEPEAIMLLRQ
jgi:molybdate transport system ATP-binding protein